MRTYLSLTAALGMALAASAGAVAAQPAGPLGPGEAPTAEMKARHEANRKQHLDDLRAILRLRPDQEPALAAFAAAHEPKRFDFKLPERAATTPERLEAMGRHEAEMRAHHEDMGQATAKFYAALSPEQQKAFDALERLKGSPGPRPMMMMRDRPGGPGGHDLMILRHGPMERPPEPPR